VIAGLVVAVLAVTPSTGGGGGGDVAISLSIAGDDAVQRDIAAAVVHAAGTRWALATKTLDGCAADNVACLRAAAQNTGASWLLDVKVAPLGVRDHVVAVRLFETADRMVFEESTVQHGSDGAPVEALCKHLLAVQPAPPAKPAAAAAPASSVKSSGPGAWTWVGAGLVAAGAIVGAATGFAASESIGRDQDATATRLIGLTASATLLVGGAAAFVVDGL
jgi:hypothetical protein